MLETKELQAKFEDVRKRVGIGSVWKHKKGGIYMVIGYGFDTELERINIHYHRIGGPNYNERAEQGIVFDRPEFLWTEERFKEISPFDGHEYVSRPQQDR